MVNLEKHKLKDGDPAFGLCTKHLLTLTGPGVVLLQGVSTDSELKQEQLLREISHHSSQATYYAKQAKFYGFLTLCAMASLPVPLYYLCNVLLDSNKLS